MFKLSWASSSLSDASIGPDRYVVRCAVREVGSSPSAPREPLDNSIENVKRLYICLFLNIPWRACHNHIRIIKVWCSGVHTTLQHQESLFSTCTILYSCDLGKKIGGMENMDAQIKLVNLRGTNVFVLGNDHSPPRQCASPRTMIFPKTLKIPVSHTSTSFIKY